MIRHHSAFSPTPPSPLEKFLIDSLNTTIRSVHFEIEKKSKWILQGVTQSWFDYHLLGHRVCSHLQELCPFGFVSSDACLIECLLNEAVISRCEFVDRSHKSTEGEGVKGPLVTRQLDDG